MNATKIMDTEHVSQGTKKRFPWYDFYSTEWKSFNFKEMLLLFLTVRREKRGMGGREERNRRWKWGSKKEHSLRWPGQTQRRPRKPKSKSPRRRFPLARDKRRKKERGRGKREGAETFRNTFFRMNDHPIFHGTGNKDGCRKSRGKERQTGKGGAKPSYGWVKRSNILMRLCACMYLLTYTHKCRTKKERRCIRAQNFQEIRVKLSSWQVVVVGLDHDLFHSLAGQTIEICRVYRV